MSVLIKDLTHVPNIIAALGLGIAQAQRHFNLDYLESLERLLVIAQSMLGGKKDAGAGAAPADLSADEQKRLEAFAGIIKEFLVAMAPPRYQFTETRLNVKLDLAQHLDVGVNAGLSAGIGAVAVNAALSVGYGYDYRAAAECQTVLHAVPMDPTTLRQLLDRAKEITTTLTLPERTTVDTAVKDQANKVFEKLVGAKPPAIEEKKPTP